MNKKNNEQGFARVIIIIAVLVVVGAAGYFVFTKLNNTYNSIASWTKGCTSNDRVSMAHMPMNIDDVQSVTPLGMVAGGHVTPIDHLYFYPKEGPRDKYPVYAMADGFIKEIAVRSVNVESGTAKKSEYRLTMQHSCQTVSYYDLVTKLDDSLLASDASLINGKDKTLNIPIKAGQTIGWIGAQSLDTSIYNMDMTLPGFNNPKMYESSEFWKVHTDDFFGYFPEQLKSQMLAKNRRTAEPRSGKIDYDQPGKLIGNWFKVGTNGYAGPEGAEVGKNSTGYWSGHLALFYDAIDPTQVVVAIGSFKDGQPGAFQVKGNTPDPAKVGVGDAAVKYELVPYTANTPTGSAKQASTNIPENPQTLGTILVQVEAGEKLKVEMFVGKTASQVSGFTTAAVKYER